MKPPEAPPKSAVALAWNAGLLIDDNTFHLSPAQETKLQNDNGTNNRFSGMPSVFALVVRGGGEAATDLRIAGHKTTAHAAIDFDLFAVDTLKSHVQFEAGTDTKTGKGHHVLVRVRFDPRQFKKNYFLGVNDGSQVGDPVAKDARDYGHGFFTEDSIEAGMRLKAGKNGDATILGVFEQEHWHPVTNRSVNVLGIQGRYDTDRWSVHDQLEYDLYPNHDEFVLVPDPADPQNNPPLLARQRVDHTYLQNDIAPGLRLALGPKANLGLTFHWLVRDFTSSNAGDAYNGRLDQRFGLEAGLSTKVAKKFKLEVGLMSERKLTHRPNSNPPVAEDVDYQNDTLGATLAGKF